MFRCSSRKQTVICIFKAVNHSSRYRGALSWTLSIYWAIKWYTYGTSFCSSTGCVFYFQYLGIFNIVHARHLCTNGDMMLKSNCGIHSVTGLIKQGYWNRCVMHGLKIEELNGQYGWFTLRLRCLIIFCIVVLMSLPIMVFIKEYLACGSCVMM